MQASAPSVVHLPAMANRCAYKDGGRRCSRNGFGNPALCKAHSIQTVIDGEQVEGLPEDSSLFELLGLADRMFSRSENETVQQVRSIFGEFLAGAANSSNAAHQVPHQRGPSRPPPRQSPPRPPQGRERAGECRAILGLEPREQLTEARIKARKRELAKIYHPDREGGSPTAMKRVNEAADYLLKSL